MPLGDEIIRSGVGLYDGTVRTEVRIVRQQITYGSGDHEDPSEVREDRAVPCFTIQWGSPGERGMFPAASGQYATLNEAVREAEALMPTIKWTID